MKQVLLTIIITMFLQTIAYAEMHCPNAKIMMPSGKHFFTINTDQKIQVCISVGHYSVFNTHQTLDGNVWDEYEVIMKRKSNSDKTELALEPGTYLIVRNK